MVLGSGITAKGIRQEKAFIHTLYNQRNFFFNFILFFKLYIIVLVLPNIKMNLPQVYMCFVSSLSCMVIGVKPPWAGKGIST